MPTCARICPPVPGCAHLSEDVSLRDEVAYEVREAVAHVDSPVVEADGGGAQVRPEVVTEQGHRKRRAARLPAAQY